MDAAALLFVEQLFCNHFYCCCCAVALIVQFMSAVRLQQDLWPTKNCHHAISATAQCNNNNNEVMAALASGSQQKRWHCLSKISTFSTSRDQVAVDKLKLGPRYCSLRKTILYNYILSGLVGRSLACWAMVMWHKWPAQHKQRQRQQEPQQWQWYSSALSAKITNPSEAKSA